MTSPDGSFRRIPKLMRRSLPTSEPEPKNNAARAKSNAGAANRNGSGVYATQISCIPDASGRRVQDDQPMSVLFRLIIDDDSH